ncbi:hypothetical protein FA048_15205 [Pedobacter polaris]|uniref:Uncharacterized protein n=1 Tax=Pedobacter polaris TaxID=2571273 RepID=A0A4V5P238_9SPHI|nr:hypothetical protein [Pedobacter polaris]TKC06556.1 hypothetical protein FA048_15205 [Pedobacter polaris]
MKKEEPNLLNDFVWLKISKDQQQVISLKLNFLDSSYAIEERFFEEGYLKFNTKSGVFIEKFNLSQHEYQVREINHVSHFIGTLDVFFSDNKSLKN